jgi:hypothetical protein
MGSHLLYYSVAAPPPVSKSYICDVFKVFEMWKYDQYLENAE